MAFFCYNIYIAYHAIQQIIVIFDKCADQEVLSEGVHLSQGFLVDDGREDLNTTRSGASSACQQTSFQLRFAGGQMMAQRGTCIKRLFGPLGG